MKKAGIYIRVSTLEQAQEGYSVGEQKERLINFCKAHDWVIQEVYVDGGYSGANLERPGIQKLISEVKNLDLVLVYKLDRLSRSQRDTLYLIEDILLPNGVDFVSMQESFDTATPFGRAMIGMLSVFAQLEREQIKERTRMGKLARAKEGLFQGGIYFPIGYDYINGKLAVNDYEAAQIRKIFEWYIEGTAPAKIADRLRLEGYTNKYSSWSELSNGTGVLRALSNDVYLGTLRYEDVVVPNAHEAIITKEIFDKAKEVRRKRQEIYGDTAYQSKYLLTGFLFCSRCGARYHVKHNYGGYKYYECYSRAQTVKKMAKAEKCDNKIWRMDDLERIIEGEVTHLFANPSYVGKLFQRKAKEKKLSKSVRSEADVIKDKISDLDKQIGKLMDLYQTDQIPTDILSSRIDKLYRDKLTSAEALNNIEPQLPPKDYDVEGVSEMLGDLSTIWDTAEQSDKRLILETLIDRILIDGENIKIEWSFLPE
jgi:site-specific DNA recombinase